MNGDTVSVIGPRPSVWNGIVLVPTAIGCDQRKPPTVMVTIPDKDSVSVTEPLTIKRLVSASSICAGTPLLSGLGPPVTLVSSGPSGDSIVDDGVMIVTTFSECRPNTVACDISLLGRRWGRFSLASKYIGYTGSR